MPSAAETHKARHAPDRRVYDRAYEQRRPIDNSFYSSKRWIRFRLWFLSQPENALCVACLQAGRTTAAKEVDHIQPRVDFPELAWEPANCQGLCKPCHTRKSNRERRADKGIMVMIVCGPPGSGKTTYVQQHKRHGDLVVDLDAILAALSFEPWYMRTDNLMGYALAARDAILQRLAMSPVPAWVIVSAPTSQERESLVKRLNGKIIMLDVDADECKRRMASDDRRRGDHWEKAVDDWWIRYEPTGSGRDAVYSNGDM